MAKKPSTESTPVVDLASLTKTVDQEVAKIEKKSSIVIIGREDFDNTVRLKQDITKRKEAFLETVKPVIDAANSLQTAVKTMCSKVLTPYEELETKIDDACREYLGTMSPGEEPPTLGRLQNGKWKAVIQDKEKLIKYICENKEYWYLLEVSQAKLSSLAGAQTTQFSLPGCVAEQGKSLFLEKE